MSTFHLVMCFSPVLILAAIAAVQMDLANYRANRVQQILDARAVEALAYDAKHKRQMQRRAMRTLP